MTSRERPRAIRGNGNESAGQSVIRHPQLFLSHVHVDRDIALALQGILHDAFGGNITIFNSSNPDSIEAGRLWRERITEQLKKIDVLLVLATPQSVLSPWVNFESGGAWVLGKPVIPCCAKGMTVSRLPRPFSDSQGIDLADKVDMRKLVQDLSRHLTEPALPDFDAALAVSRLDELWQPNPIPELSADLQSFLTAFEVFVSPPEKIELSSDYESLLSEHLPTIKELVRQLDAAREWDKLVEVKIRLREYFEYTARYEDGVEFGRRYVRALDELGDSIESLWTKAKHVGYLLVLARRHGEARQELEDALQRSEALGDSPSSVELRFYCHRYLGISFQRDTVSGDRRKAEQHFRMAEQCVESPLIVDSRKKKELSARIKGNFGNLSMDAGEYDRAIDCFSEELATFKELGDVEHIGIAHLKLAQAMIARKDLDHEAAREHLANAERAAEQCRWFEGRARIWEQRAKLFERQAEEVDGKRQRLSYIKLGIEAANRAAERFGEMDDRVAAQRVEGIIRSLTTQEREIGRARGGRKPPV